LKVKQFNYTKGKLGEEIAAGYLKKKGYCIIKSNYRTRFGELDIIASIDKILVFVEVKLKTLLPAGRAGIDFGTPEEMINPRKLRQIQNTAEMFLLQENILRAKFKQYRIDAICIVLNQDTSIEQIKHYENITG